MAIVTAVARAPLPDLVPAETAHFNQCMRTLLAVLPKRGTDEISGKLFVAAYQKKLGTYPGDAIGFLADKAMERCRWFPTIAECLEILSKWHRDDEHVRRKIAAREIVDREERARSRGEI